MTVGETISASSIGGAGAIPVQDAVVAVAGRTGGGGGSSGGSSSSSSSQVHPMVLKVNQEVVTSLHLIKDIRRLEKYQRDFFLKVKESLSHVHALLDHQLMDMAWSDNLADCEENLLKVSTHVQNSSSTQLADVYNILLHDREKLNNRFHELSVKSSLSEFVVNSRQLLDINAVRIAAEAILKNEKPSPAQGDPSIPVDHTFFLCNFCTTSLASSMMASFVPKPAMSQEDAMATAMYHPTRQQQLVSRYDAKRINGSMMANQAVAAAAAAAAAADHSSQMRNPSEPSQQSEVVIATSLASSNGIGIGQQEYGSNLAVVQQQQQQQQSGVTMYDVETGGGLDKYLAATNTIIDGRATVDAVSAQNGMYTGHELVSAISQITRTGGGGGGGSQSSATKMKKGEKVSHQGGDPWESLAPTQGSGEDATLPSSDRYRQQQRQPESPAAAAAAAAVEMNPPNDNSSDSISTVESEVIVAADQHHDIAGGSKPLSFARIASLNIDKQAVQRPSKPQLPVAAPASVMSAAAAAAAAGLSPQSLVQLSVPAVVPPAATAALQPSVCPMSMMPQMGLPVSSNPRFYLDLSMEGRRLGRVIIEVQPLVSPKMSLNFSMLVSGEKGFGYKGCQFFQAWKNESVICGDWEHNSGRGGRAALEGGPLFTPDDTRLPCVRGAVGMRRMSKKHSSLNQVASQFRIILANMNTQFTGIFGHVVSGIEALDKIADIGGEGGRPEKIAVVSACGIYKS